MRIAKLLLLAMCLIGFLSHSHAQSRGTNDVVAEQVEFRDGELRGVLKNNTPHRVRDVELEIRYFWVWKVQHRLRRPAPELSFAYKVHREIAPRGSVPFSYRTPALPARSDGYYDIEVKVARSVNVDDLGTRANAGTSVVNPELKTNRDVANIVDIEDLVVTGPVVSGVLRNKAPHRVRDVELLIRNVWVPNNEYRPGGQDPGRSAYHTVLGEIPPDGFLPFTYDAEPLPRRTDGRFQTKVSVAGFVELASKHEVQDRDGPRIQLRPLLPAAGRGEDVARLDAAVEDPAGLAMVEIWLNGERAAGEGLAIETRNQQRIQITRTFALPRPGTNCVAIAARDTRGNSAISEEVCLRRGGGAAATGYETAKPVMQGRHRASGTAAATPTQGNVRAARDTDGPRIELLHPRPGKNIAVGTVAFEAVVDDASGIEAVDVWLNENKLPASGDVRGRQRTTVKRAIQVTEMGINCFALNARDVAGNVSKERVCLIARREAAPAPRASARASSAPAPPAMQPVPGGTPPPAPGVPRSAVGMSMQDKIQALKRHYMEKEITAQQFDRAVRTLESGKSDQLLEDFINGDISVSTFRLAF